MYLSEICDLFNKIKQDKVVGGLACSVTVLVIFVATFFRFVISELS